MILAARTLHGTNCNDTVPQNIALSANKSGDIKINGRNNISIEFENGLSRDLIKYDHEISEGLRGNDLEYLEFSDFECFLQE